MQFNIVGTWKELMQWWLTDVIHSMPSFLCSISLLLLLIYIRLHFLQLPLILLLLVVVFELCYLLVGTVWQFENMKSLKAIKICYCSIVICSPLKRFDWFKTLYFPLTRFQLYHMISPISFSLSTFSLRRFDFFRSLSFVIHDKKVWITFELNIRWCFSFLLNPTYLLLQVSIEKRLDQLINWMNWMLLMMLNGLSSATAYIQTNWKCWNVSK